MDIKQLNSTQLELAIRKAEKVERDFIDTFIARGRGYEKMSDIRASAEQGFDALALDYTIALAIGSELRNEKKRRLRYHGSTKPIKAV